MLKKRLIIIGGGAAGFFCALNAAAMNSRLEVIILEKTSKLLNKVRISGGGRCNVTHSSFSISQLIKSYPRGSKFLKQAFHHFFTSDTISWFQQRGIELKTEHDGRMFPVSDSSQTIIDCFLAETAKYSIHVSLQKELVAIEKVGTAFQLHLKDGNRMKCDFLCIACGGFHKLDQYAFVRQLGHSFVPPVPSLFTFNMPKHPITQLMGLSAPARIKINGTRFSQEGPLLITHWGMSGPAILKLSAFAALELNQFKYNFSISVNWVPEEHESSVYERLMNIAQEQASRKIGNKNPFGLPQRLWNYHLEQCGVDGEERWANFKAAQRSALAKQLCSGQFKVTGKTTFKEEFVTAGGIELKEVSSATLESKVMENLFFAGEILNIDGITGGFNFQSAWTTAWIAAKTIAEKANQ